MDEIRIAIWTGAGGNLCAVENSLRRWGCHVEHVSTFERLWQLMELDVDLVIATCQNAPEVLLWMKGMRLAGSATPPVLTLASALDVERYLQTMGMGAFDCVALPVQESELRRLVSRAVEERRTERQLLSA